MIMSDSSELAPVPANSTARSPFIAAGAGSRHPIFPGVEIVTNAGDQIMLSVVHFEPEAVVPMHSHPHEQAGYLVSGCLEFTINGETRLLSPGDQWRIAGGLPHTVKAVGGPAVALDIFHPIRLDYL